MSLRSNNKTDDLCSLLVYGLNTGGPGVITVGWIIVGFFSKVKSVHGRIILMSDSHGRCSQYGRNRFRNSSLWRPLLLGLHACASTTRPVLFLDHWLVECFHLQKLPSGFDCSARFNLLGQIAITAGAEFGLANLISTTAQVTNGYEPSPGKTLGMVAVILLSHAIVNLFSIRHLRYMVYTAIVLNSVLISALAIAVLSGSKTHNSVKFVFGKFFDGTAADDSQVGWSVRASPAYVAVCGILFSQYTLLGFDASAHLCEETKQAVRVAPWCLLSAVGASFVFGFFVLVALLSSIQDFERVRKSPLPILEIFTDACGQRGGLVLISIVMLCVWHCGLFSIVSIHLCINTRDDHHWNQGSDNRTDQQFPHDVFFRAGRWYSTQATHHRHKVPLPDQSCHLCSCMRFSSLPALSWLYYRLFRDNLHRHYRPVHLLRYPYRDGSRLAPKLQARDVQSWPCQ